MCKKKEFKQFDKMTSEEKEASYRLANRITHRSMLITEAAIPCQYCGLDIPVSASKRHENSCVLSKITLEEFISEMMNPTMSRTQLTKKLTGNKMTYFNRWNQFKAEGMIPSDLELSDASWTKELHRSDMVRIPCKYCGYIVDSHHLPKHENSCVLSKISIQEFTAELINPTMTRVDFMIKCGRGTKAFGILVGIYKKLGLIPSDAKRTGNYIPNRVPKKTKENYECKYCGLSIKKNLLKHENSCVLSRISLDEFVSELANPTMTRAAFNKKYKLGNITALVMWKRFKELGIIPRNKKIGYYSTTPKALRRVRRPVGYLRK